MLLQLLLNRGADPAAVDSMGRTALQHAMHLDKAASLRVAAALLQVRMQRGSIFGLADAVVHCCTDTVLGSSYTDLCALRA